MRNRAPILGRLSLLLTCLVALVPALPTPVPVPQAALTSAARTASDALPATPRLGGLPSPDVYGGAQ
jgi:hypothetical protein